MTLKHFRVSGLSFALIGCTSISKKATHPIEARAHSFAIYLVAFTPDKPWDAATIGDLATLPLSNEPLLSDADIVSYDFAKHEILTSPAAILSLKSNGSVWGVPFVVVADGERIYVGAITSAASSASISVPTILMWASRFANPLSIDRAYPSPEFGSGPDPRSDERVRVALAGLKELK